MSRLIVLAFFLCPYLTTCSDIVNDLGYYSCLFVSAGFYSVKILISLMYLLSMERLLHAGRKCMDALNGNRSFCERMSSGHHQELRSFRDVCMQYGISGRTENGRIISALFYIMRHVWRHLSSAS